MKEKKEKKREKKRRETQSKRKEGTGFCSMIKNCKSQK